MVSTLRAEGMKKNRLLVIFMLMLMLGSTYADDDTSENSYIKELIYAAINFYELENYYHIAELPNRIPLRVLINDVVVKNYHHIKFGKPVLYVSEKPHIIFNSISVDNKNTAKVVFRYIPEGLKIKIILRKNSTWEVISSELKEE